MACFLGHKWDNCKCTKCGKIRDEGHNYQPIDGKCVEKCAICGKMRDTAHKWNGEACEICGAPNPNAFCLDVCGKYSAFGGIYAEGYIRYGQLRVGDTVYLYDEKGESKIENGKVMGLINAATIKSDVVEKSKDKTYAAVMISGVQYLGDIDKNDIISRQKMKFAVPPQPKEPAQEREMPPAKTYNDPDKKQHVLMATNDISAMCVSGSLASNREYIRNVAQDLYDAHGFEAMQEVFINVKTRYPGAQSQLSAIWDGVGGWAD